MSDCGDCDCGDCDCGDCDCGDCDCADCECSSLQAYLCGNLCIELCEICCICCTDTTNQTNQRYATAATEPMLSPQQHTGIQPVIGTQSPIVYQPTVMARPVIFPQSIVGVSPSAPTDMQSEKKEDPAINHQPPSYEEAVASTPVPVLAVSQNLDDNKTIR